jgi:hypothetical protein
VSVGRPSPNAAVIFARALTGDQGANMMPFGGGV